MGRRSCLIDCINDLAALSVKPHEILVIEQGGIPDPLPEIGQLNIRQFHCKEPNASLARNIGLIEAKGDIVLFLDDDVRISNSDFLENHLRHYDDPSVPGVYGQVLEIGQVPSYQPDPSVIATDTGWMDLPANYGRPCRTRNGASNNLSVRRDLALSVGGMDTWFEKGAIREETDFNLRLTGEFGYLVFDPHANLQHLSADGGSRSWGRNIGFTRMHHIIGHWYFFLRALKDAHLSLNGIKREIRYIAIGVLKNPQSDMNPFIFLTNFARAVYGLGAAGVRILLGPKRIDKIDKKIYAEIYKSEQKNRHND